VLASRLCGSAPMMTLCCLLSGCWSLYVSFAGVKLVAACHDLRQPNVRVAVQPVRLTDALNFEN
jgi:hypothetical protein